MEYRIHPKTGEKISVIGLGSSALASASEALAHVRSKHASDCVHCGHCDRRCPFHVVQSARMTAIADYFGK